MRWTVRKVIEDYVECIRTGQWHENRHLATVWFTKDGELFRRATNPDGKVVAFPVPSLDGKPTVIVDKSVWHRSSSWGRELARMFDACGVRQLETITTRVESMIGLTDNPVLWVASFSKLPRSILDRLVERYRMVRGIPSSSQNWLPAASAVRQARRLNHKAEMLFRCHELAQGEMDDDACVNILDNYQEARALLSRIGSNVRLLETRVHQFASDSLLALPNEVREVLRKLNEIASDKGLWGDRLEDARLAALAYIDKRPSGLLFLGKMLRHRWLKDMVLDRNRMPDTFMLLSLLLKYGRYDMIARALSGRMIPPAELLRFAQAVGGELQGSRKDISLAVTRLHIDTAHKVDFVVAYGEEQMASIDPVFVKWALETLSGGKVNE